MNVLLSSGLAGRLRETIQQRRRAIFMALCSAPMAANEANLLLDLGAAANDAQTSQNSDGELLHTLQMIEWVEIRSTDDGAANICEECPACGNHKPQGHTDGCPIRKALANAKVRA